MRGRSTVTDNKIRLTSEKFKQLEWKALSRKIHVLTNFWAVSNFKIICHPVIHFGM